MRKFAFSVTHLAVLCWLLLALPLLSVVAAPSSAFAQTNRFHMDEYNADITINQDGSLDVTETLVYVYDQGSFRRGLREISLGRVDSITNVRLEEVTNGAVDPYRETSFNEEDEADFGVPGTFGTKREGNLLRIRWVYDRTSNASRTFHLSYHANGAIRVYSDRDEFDWFPVPQDWGGQIYSSRVQLNLPSGVDANNLSRLASEPQSAEVSKSGNTVTWSTNNVDNGFEVGAQIPKGILQATTPAWQNAVDAEEKSREEFKRIKPLLDVGLLLASVLILVLGILWNMRRWYKAGRDKQVKLLSDYITEPPSDLPPGLVGTLLDESADVRDVIATVVDMGRKGNLTIRESEQGGLFSSKDFEYTQTGNKVQYQFEEMVMNSFFKHGNPVNLSDLKNTFYSDLPPIYNQMYQSLVGLKYFPENPQGVRTRNRVLGIFLLIAGGALAFVGITFADVFTPFLAVPGVALGIVGLVTLGMAGIMPRKTDMGSEQAEKWRAFSRYLQQMQKYTNVQAAADKFQQYLPYAVALGVERELTHQFNSVPSAMPTYYAPYGYYPGYYPVGTGAGGERSMGSPMGGGGSGGGMPSLDPGQAMQGMSDSFAGAMQGMSDSFASMVNSASSALVSQPQSSGSSGGGWGGGGGSFGGGGGGGGGGGAD